MDCNNFFVSCERLFRPDLWGKPVAVLSSNDGVIVARSNEVKAMGVPMGMPLFQAKKLVDMTGVTLFSSNFTLYRDISSRVMEVLAEEVGQCEIYSIDEAFFKISEDITETELTALRNRIISRVGIPVSIGVAKTKTLAKVGSEQGKKDGTGICLLTDEKWNELAISYPAGEVWNLGRSMAAKLREQNVTTADDFRQLDTSYVQKVFGVGGRRVQDELNGIIVHKVGENSRSVRQSIMSTRSFAGVVQKRSELDSALSYHVTEVARKLREKKLLTSRIYVLARAGRHSDFAHRQSTVDVVLDEPTNDTTKLIKFALQALDKLYDPSVPYKKVGVTMASLMPESYRQTSLFDTDEQADKDLGALDRVRDQLNARFGAGALRQGVILKSGANTSAKLRSPQYTTRWGDIPRVVAK